LHIAEPYRDAAIISPKKPAKVSHSAFSTQNRAPWQCNAKCNCNWIARPRSCSRGRAGSSAVGESKRLCAWVARVCAWHLDLNLRDSADLRRENGLAGDSELAPHTTNHLLGGHGGLDAGHDEPKSLDDVVHDRRWWAAPSEHPPDDNPQLPAGRAEAPIFSTARAERLEREGGDAGLRHLRLKLFGDALYLHGRHLGVSEKCRRARGQDAASAPGRSHVGAPQWSSSRVQLLQSRRRDGLERDKLVGQVARSFASPSEKLCLALQLG
jgi:hypothetical protein